MVTLLAAFGIGCGGDSGPREGWFSLTEAEKCMEQYRIAHASTDHDEVLRAVEFIEDLDNGCYASEPQEAIPIDGADREREAPSN